MGTFGFIIHPIDVKDVSRKFPAAQWLPGGLVECLLRFLPPQKVSHITGIESESAKADGWFVSCPLTSRMMLEAPESKVISKIIKAGQLAADLGAKVVGLGAFTAVVGDAGLTVRRNLDIAVTTGNSYTASVAIEAAERAAGAMGIDLDSASITILGATGSIGRVVSLILADRGRNLTLFGRNKSRLLKTAGAIKDQTGMVPRVTQEIEGGLRQADIVICVSSALDALVEPDHLKPGAVVCDVSRPRSVSVEVKKQRNDVLVIEGGIVKVPGNVNFNFDFGFLPHQSYACMAETMILALEEKYVDWSIGRELSLSQVTGISRLAQKHGFELAGFRSFEKPVTDEEIVCIRENARKRRRGI